MILVDYCVPCRQTAKWPCPEACHMFAFPGVPLEDLHAMAKRIGLRREYFREHASLPHYDLSRTKQLIAISYGAKLVGRATVVEAMRQWGAERRARYQEETNARPRKED